MKFLFLFFTLFTVSKLFAATTIVEQTKRLASVAEGRLVTYDLRGNNPQELIMSFAEQVSLMGREEAEIVYNYTNLKFVDEIAYGSTNAQTFSDLVFTAIHFMDDEAKTENEKFYSQQELAVIQDALKQLQTLPVIYSWDPNGNTVCGSSLTTPVIIDSAQKKAYAMDFYFIGGC